MIFNYIVVVKIQNYYGDTGVVIYANSVCGARSNFEGGPSALAAGLTGRTPRYGLHLDEQRQATRRFHVSAQPKNLTDWGILGAVIGKKSGSYWEVPLLEGIENVTSAGSGQIITDAERTRLEDELVEKTQTIRVHGTTSQVNVSPDTAQTLQTSRTFQAGRHHQSCSFKHTIKKT